MANNTTDSVEGSIDLVVDELQTQLTRLKDKLKTLRQRGARSIKKKAVIDDAARFKRED